MYLRRLGIIALMLPSAAYAYFDPGTGSLIIQALIGGLAAITVFWGRVKLYFNSLFSGGQAQKSEAPGEFEDPVRQSDQGESPLSPEE